MGLVLTAGVAVLMVALGLASLTTRTSPPASPTVPHVGFLTPGVCSGDIAPTRAPASFFEGLETLGYTLGKNLIVECRLSDGTESNDRRQAFEFARLNVAVIFAVSSSAVRAARSATGNVPIVALDLETGPVAGGLASSLARPGANVTGIFLDVPELSGKRLELLREALPGLKRVAILWDVAMDRAPLVAMEHTAQSLGIQASVIGVRAPGDLEAAIARAVRERAGALVLIQSPLMDGHRKQIAALTLKYRLPAMGLFPSFVE